MRWLPSGSAGMIKAMRRRVQGCRSSGQAEVEAMVLGALEQRPLLTMSISSEVECIASDLGMDFGQENLLTWSDWSYYSALSGVGGGAMSRVGKHHGLAALPCWPEPAGRNFTGRWAADVESC
ncbi:hypothetical protein U1Q18_007234 [Sarracenia purpurea var. burkii]